MKIRNTFLGLITFMFLTISCCPKCEKPEVAKPNNLLTYFEVVSMLKQYDATKKPVLETAFGKQDTRVINIPIEQLKNYIAHVEKKSAEKNIDVTGINFIMSAYPNNYKVPEFRGHQTIMYMPATTINGKENVSFEPLYSSDGKPVAFETILNQYNYNLQTDENKEGAKKMMMNRNSDKYSSAGNKGTISPPM